MLARLFSTPCLPVSSQARSPLFFLQVFLGYLFSAKSDGQRSTWQDLGYSPLCPQASLFSTKPNLAKVTSSLSLAHCPDIPCYTGPSEQKNSLPTYIHNTKPETLSFCLHLVKETLQMRFRILDEQIALDYPDEPNRIAPS